ncbi:NAD-dependent epimerase family protein [Candidatus Bealeia paramacronuclearis]|uniref:NAD-dependent epimerase family protein n=1 Tax=Candidatus Bealeia paramacronuclearis TaxID=1921001 RepID=A0ABZ2C4X0_9PROT|nr:NAD-dependent epimerase family protein [Candidatus Bealeia paramacronuclearis]
MKFLVTGTAGFIGNHTALRLLNKGHEVIGIDDFNPYYSVSLKEDRNDRIKDHPNFTLYREGLENLEKIKEIFKEHRPDKVIHLAAQPGVRYSLINPEAYTRSNVTGTLSILESCRTYPVEHLIYASTSSVYGANTKLPFEENDAVDHPLTLYAATKRANELMAHSYSYLFKIPTSGLRFFTVYGPWGRPDMAFFLFTKNILEGKPIDVFNNGDMERDFTYIEDIVSGILNVAATNPGELNPEKLHVADKSAVAPYQIYNIGNNKRVQLMHYIKVIEDVLGIEAQKNFLPMQNGDVQKTFASVDKLEKNAGYRPSTSVEVGVKNFVEWYRNYYQV